MAYEVVKIIETDDGDVIDEEDRRWHYSIVSGGSPTTLCSGEVYGEGEGSAKFEAKIVSRGITCEECIRIIKELKSVKL